LNLLVAGAIVVVKAPTDAQANMGIVTTAEAVTDPWGRPSKHLQVMMVGSWQTRNFVMDNVEKILVSVSAAHDEGRPKQDWPDTRALDLQAKLAAKHIYATPGQEDPT
jgi:hypothetical protein